MARKQGFPENIGKSSSSCSDDLVCQTSGCLGEARPSSSGAPVGFGRLDDEASVTTSAGASAATLRRRAARKKAKDGTEHVDIEPKEQKTMEERMQEITGRMLDSAFDKLSAKLDDVVNKLSNGMDSLEDRVVRQEAQVEELLRQRDRARAQRNNARLKAIIERGKALEYRRELGYSSGSSENVSSGSEPEEDECTDDEDEEGDDDSLTEEEVDGETDESDAFPGTSTENVGEQIAAVVPHHYLGADLLTFQDGQALRRASRSHAELMLGIITQSGLNT